MPNRIIRDAILTSESVCSLGWPEEVFYRRLMSIVDDYGRHEASVQLLRSRCYPLQTDQVRVADISRWMAACQKAGLILVYEVAGKQYLQLQKFGQQQRSASKCPAPLSSDSNCNQPPASAPVFGVEDVFVDVTPPPPTADAAGGAFERFWKAWPSHHRKVAKDQCRAKWKAKGCDGIVDAVIASVEAAKLSEDWVKERGSFIPSPLVWLNQSRWEAPPGDPPAAKSADLVASGEVARTQALLAAQAAVTSSPEARQEAVAKMRKTRAEMGVA